jgi:hypothetical protein
MLSWLKTPDLTGDFAVEICRVERLKTADAAAALDEGVPKCLQVVSDRTDDADTSDDDSSFVHVKKLRRLHRADACSLSEDGLVLAMIFLPEQASPPRLRKLFHPQPLPAFSTLTSRRD